MELEKNVLEQFREKVSEKITLREKGMHRYTVRTPFFFEDGDHLVVVLKYSPQQKNWVLTDEGHTFMHLSYFMDEKDLCVGTRRDIIDSAYRMFGVSEKEGELSLEVENEAFGDALYDFVQCLLKISDITFLERERVKSTFFEDFKSSVKALAKRNKTRADFDCHVSRDRHKAYKIDCCITTKKGGQLFVFAINNDNKCRDAMITVLMLEKWNIKFNAVGVFENQEKIGRSVLARFSDVSDKQISNLDSIERLVKCIEN